jgi:hypothetical protein
MKKILAVFVALFAVTVAACTPDTTQPGPSGSVLVAEAGDTVRLAIGQSVNVAGELRVTFRGVGEDSRCPIDALCIWPGTAEVKLELQSSGQAPVSRTVHTFSEPRSITHGGFRIRPVEVAPMPTLKEPTNPSDYIVRLEITRG